MREKLVEKMRKPFNSTVGTAINKIPEPYSTKTRYLISYMVSPHIKKVPYGMRYKMWKNGLAPGTYNLYNFDKNEIDEYLSNIDRRIKTGDINYPNEEYLDDKTKFIKILVENGYEDYLPEHYGVVDDGILLGSEIKLTKLLKQEQKLAIKDSHGSGGKQFHKLEFSSGTYLIDGDKIQESELVKKLSKYDEYLVTEYCEQANYVKKIFPETANTVRILTINPSDSDPYISIAVQRIGTKESIPVDNFGRGGISASVGDKGELSEGVRRDGYSVRWHQSHPDTGSEIKGVKIPGWDKISDKILNIAADLESLPYIAWDIIVIGEGEFRIIEGNNRTDIDLLQCHKPLLQDSRTLSFYKENGVIED